ncbi:MAG: hypothetical protein P8166_17945, partial [Candidatus Thiodiazotropha sp.]
MVNLCCPGYDSKALLHACCHTRLETELHGEFLQEIPWVVVDFNGLDFASFYIVKLRNLKDELPTLWGVDPDGTLGGDSIIAGGMAVNIDAGDHLKKTLREFDKLLFAFGPLNRSDKFNIISLDAATTPRVEDRPLCLPIPSAALSICPS